MANTLQDSSSSSSSTADRHTVQGKEDKAMYAKLAYHLKTKQPSHHATYKSLPVAGQKGLSQHISPRSQLQLA